MKTNPDQLSLPLFDTTALTSSMGLYSGLTLGALVDDAIAETEEDGPAPVVVPARNFRLTGARRLAPDWKTRAADNIAAIRLMRQIEEEARNATRQEQERLALFTSFGAGDLANNLFRRSAEETFPKGWAALGEDLEELVSPAELTSLARVTQYAHFTPEFMVRAIWRALIRMGFSGGRALEPGCGTGLFFALMPETLEAKTTLTGVEMDPITARIARLLHPNARIRAEDFTKARIAETYDLVVGNPPFSSRTVRADDPAGRVGLSPHDYFVARSIDRLRPGGLAAFVTSRWTMDKADPTARKFIASMADLVGAVRLPEGAMRAAAGTDVVVDILFFQKRGPDEPAKPANWIGLAEVMAAQDGEEALSINRHFLERPGMVLGSHARTSSAYGPTYTCLPVRSEPDALFQDLLAALHTLPADVYMGSAPVRLERETLVDETIRVGTAAEGATIKEGSYLVVKDRLAQIIDRAPVAVAIRQGLGRHTGEACAHHSGPHPDSRRSPRGSARPRIRSSLGRGAGPIARGLRTFQAGVRPDQPDDDQRDHKPRRRSPRDRPPPEPSALPRRSRRMARLLDRGLRRRDRRREAGPDLQRAGAPSTRHAGDRERRRCARGRAARDRGGRSRPRRRASRRHARGFDRGSATSRRSRKLRLRT
jgi:adenine-specific DNA methylase